MAHFEEGDPTLVETMTAPIESGINEAIPVAALVGVPILVATVVWRLVKRFARG